MKKTKITETVRLHRLSVKKWHDIDGENTFRIDYNLNKDSIVFDLGGCIGEWSEKIFSRYNSNIFIFEPVKNFVKIMRKKFLNNDKIKIFRIGLSDITKDVIISVDKTASSIYKDGNKKEKIRLVEIKHFLDVNNIVKIDLMKINIEGGEYDLLDHMIKKDIVKIVDNIQIQFHQFVPDAEKRMLNIQRNLEKTHHLTYQQRCVNENWKLNE